MAHATADPWKSVSKPPSDVELTKSLALLGFGSWTALEPKNERENGVYVKEKLSEALREKIESIEAEREKEAAELKKLENMTKKQREKYEMQKKKKKKVVKKKTLIQEEREAHEAYQLVLSEHYRRVKQRVRQKTKTLGLLGVNAAFKAKSTENLSTEVSESAPDNNFDF